MRGPLEIRGNDAPLIGRWAKMAMEALDGKSLAWRQKWLDLHQIELAEIRWSRPDRRPLFRLHVPGDRYRIFTHGCHHQSKYSAAEGTASLDCTRNRPLQRNPVPRSERLRT